MDTNSIVSCIQWFPKNGTVIHLTPDCEYRDLSVSQMEGVAQDSTWHHARDNNEGCATCLITTSTNDRKRAREEKKKAMILLPTGKGRLTVGDLLDP